MLPTPPASPTLSGGYAPPQQRLGQILAGRLQFIGILGEGAYGTVYKAVDIHSGVQYAVKALNKLNLEPRQRKFQQREIQLHHLASSHPNVVSLVKIMDSPECTYVVLEYCPDGDLFSNITERGRYARDDELARRAFLQILDAVGYCHSMGIYHRDLKPENILVTDNGNTVKLADFGLATSDPYTSDFGCGSTFYMSPECQQPNPKAYASYESAPNDVWSLGVILVNLTCGRNPWKKASLEDSTFRAFMKDPNFLRTILPISYELDAILRRIFDPNPATRIKLPELRDMIQLCPRFTKAPTPIYAPAPISTPPIQPYDQCNPGFQPGMMPMPQPYMTNFIPQAPISPPPYSLQYPLPSISSGSSGSDTGSVFSHISSTSSASSNSSISHVNSVPCQGNGIAHHSYVPSPANAWLSSYFQQAGNLVKQFSQQLSFQRPLCAH
ncbi:hypothetical protein MPH_02508 [Macrophomina phaseolina MS6]|uniref:non-specific serine/threonine protein kinase n=1 Tax=Macrophomina phaseolina (strain MS6) TaxID=1126212 RepID=K2RC95_MACPH|nr:hypothetical protein MPH_02508 [Macrophomina phaseolina MS6]